MSVITASFDRAWVCGVSDTGSHVVHTLAARRAPSATCHVAEHVRPIANSSRLRYCSRNRASSPSPSSGCASNKVSRTGRNTAFPSASTYRVAWNSHASAGIRPTGSASLHKATSTSL